MTGLFITFEGGEGSGKSTQARLLFDKIKNKNIIRFLAKTTSGREFEGESEKRIGVYTEVYEDSFPEPTYKLPTESGFHKKSILTREPGGSQGADLIRTLLVQGDISRWDPLTEVFLLMAARRDHWLRVIQPVLEKGGIVLCDRFHDSTRVYQGFARKIDLGFLDLLYKNIIGQREPDRTYIFDIDPQEGLKRTLERKKNQNENRYEKMSLDFHQTIRKGYLDIIKTYPDRCFKIDASRSVEEIHTLIWNDIKPFINKLII